MKRKEQERAATERTDLVTLTAPDGYQYTNGDHSMTGKVVVCLAGHEDSLTLISDEEAELYAKSVEEEKAEEQ